jgi:hypothetical protein
VHSFCSSDKLQVVVVDWLPSMGSVGGKFLAVKVNLNARRACNWKKSNEKS